MKAPTSAIRFTSASTLLDFGFNNFEYKKMIGKDDIVKSAKVSKGVKTDISVIAENNCGTIVDKGNNLNISQNIEMPDVIEAPIKKGDKLGKITYILNDEKISECNLVADSDIDKMNFISMEQFVLDRWFRLLR